MQLQRQLHQHQNQQHYRHARAHHRCGWSSRGARFPFHKAATAAAGASGKARNVVIAIDKTAESELAITWAASHLLRADDRVHIFAFADVSDHTEHVFSTPGGKHMVRCDNALASVQDAQDKQAGVLLARTLVDKYGPRLAKAVGNKVALQAHVLPSIKASMGQALCDQADALEAAAVVLASHTRAGGGLRDLFGGASVADYAVRHCSRPVVVLHDEPQAKKSASNKQKQQQQQSAVQPAPVPAPAGPRQLVVAVDSTPESVAACEWILEHLHRPGDVIHLLHVVPCLPLTMPLSPSDYLLLCKPQLDSDPWLQEQEQLMAQEEVQRWQETQASMFRGIMEKAGAEHTFDTLVRFSEDLATAISTAICSKAVELQAAAVILSVHEERAEWLEALMPSITNQVSHRCLCPVVVLHGSSGSSSAAGAAVAGEGSVLGGAAAGAGTAEPVAA